MNSNLEIEYKMLLKQEDFEALRQLYPNYTPILQINTYYDCVEAPLKARGIGMRIRTIGKKHRFTLKRKVLEGHEEFETDVQELSSAVFNIPEIQEIFDRFSIHGPFFESGKLTTWRTEIPFETGTLCLDQNSYYGKTDYELEYELKPDADPEEGLQQFQKILDQIHLPYQRNKRSKIQRCLEEKRRIEL